MQKNFTQICIFDYIPQIFDYNTNVRAVDVVVGLFFYTRCNILFVFLSVLGSIWGVLKSLVTRNCYILFHDCYKTLNFLSSFFCVYDIFLTLISISTDYVPPKNTDRFTKPKLLWEIAEQFLKSLLIFELGYTLINSGFNYLFSNMCWYFGSLSFFKWDLVLALLNMLLFWFSLNSVT